MIASENARSLGRPLSPDASTSTIRGSRTPLSCCRKIAQTLLFLLCSWVEHAGSGNVIFRVAFGVVVGGKVAAGLSVGPVMAEEPSARTANYLDNAGSMMDRATVASREVRFVCVDVMENPGTVLLHRASK